MRESRMAEAEAEVASGRMLRPGKQEVLWLSRSHLLVTDTDSPRSNLR